MGSSLRPTLANAFLCHYEKGWLDSSPNKFKSKLYKRYLDDIFVMFRSRNHVKNFVDYMNTKHPNIRFTFDIENQNSFWFLNIKIIRSTKKKTFEALVYRKSTFNGVFTNFKRFIPMTYIISMFLDMLFLWKVSRENCQAQRNLKTNFYSENFIDRCIKNLLKKLQVPKVVELTAVKKELTLVLPYLGQQSFEFRSRICVKKNAPVFNL